MWLETLRNFKKESGKTNEQIAVESDIPLGTLNKLFAGQTKDPQYSTLRKVVHCLGHTIDDLDEKSTSTEAEARIEDLINSQRGQVLLGKYSVLTEPAQDRVDATVNDIWSNPVNRIDQQQQEPSANTRTIDSAAWGIGPTTTTVNVDEATLQAAEEERLRRQADRLMAERNRTAAAKKGFGRKRKK
ncbi:hypothetical protein BN3661_02214 [Eubacteriaceae bacterium CHKCI005]|nr:hypothetical protein BN3661_02214 [Eubacteriaceae bacterium CHKCI005]